MNMFKSTKLAALVGIGMLLSVTSGAVGPSIPRRRRLKEYTNQEVEGLLRQMVGLSSVTRRRLAGGRRRLGAGQCDHQASHADGFRCTSKDTVKVQIGKKTHNRCPIHKQFTHYSHSDVVEWADKAFGEQPNKLKKSSRCLTHLKNTKGNGKYFENIMSIDQFTQAGFQYKDRDDHKKILSKIQAVRDATNQWGTGWTWKRLLGGNHNGIYKCRDTPRGECYRATGETLKDLQGGSYTLTYDVPVKESNPIQVYNVRKTRWEEMSEENFGRLTAIKKTEPKVNVRSNVATTMTPGGPHVANGEMPQKPAHSTKPGWTWGSQLRPRKLENFQWMKVHRTWCYLNKLGDTEFGVAERDPSQAFKLSDNKWYRWDATKRTYV